MYTSYKESKKQEFAQVLLEVMTMECVIPTATLSIAFYLNIS